MLDVQALDSRADRLRHQIGSLPELDEIAALTRSHQETSDRMRDLRIFVDDLSLEQRRADADVEQVKSRRQRDNDRIDQGLITNPKDLERMQQELVSLERRIGTLEDAELEIMEKLEDAQRELDQLAGQVVSAEERLAVLTASRDAKVAELQRELADIAAERTGMVGDLPEPLVALYERLRGAKGGVGAAMLRARQCEGCRLTVDHAELAVIGKAPDDEVIRCEECQRILVRTAESGL